MAVSATVARHVYCTSGNNVDTEQSVTHALRTTTTTHTDQKKSRTPRFHVNSR